MNFVFWGRVWLTGFMGVVFSVTAIALTPKHAENLLKSIEVIVLFLCLVAIMASFVGMVWTVGK